MCSAQKVITYFLVRFPNRATVREFPCSGILINVTIVATLALGYFIKYFDSKKKKKSAKTDLFFRKKS